MVHRVYLNDPTVEAHPVNPVCLDADAPAAAGPAPGASGKPEGAERTQACLIVLPEDFEAQLPSFLEGSRGASGRWQIQCCLMVATGPEGIGSSLGWHS